MVFQVFLSQKERAMPQCVAKYGFSKMVFLTDLQILTSADILYTMVKIFWLRMRCRSHHALEEIGRGIPILPIPMLIGDH